MLFSGFKGRTNSYAQSFLPIFRREFYDGDIESETGSYDGVEIGKALSSPLTVTQITSRHELKFRRSPAHIRNNRVGLRVLCFVFSGSLKIVRSSGTSEVKAGQAAFLDSNVPFTASVSREGEECHRSIQLVMLPDVFMASLHDAEYLTEPFDVDGPSGGLMYKILEVLLEAGDAASEETAQMLVKALLNATAEHLRNGEVDLPKRHTLVDRRFLDIENFIKLNLADPNLSHDQVASACGISPRYLCYLLKSHNTSFSELVWKNRLPLARNCLSSPATRHYPIHQIAHMSGFKSAAHFSRVFKAEYGIPPSEFRAQSANAAIDKQETELTVMQ